MERSPSSPLSVLCLHVFNSRLPHLCERECCGALSNIHLQGHPNWLNLGGVVHGFDSQTVLSLVNHNPAPVNLLSVSLRCDVAEFLSVTLRAENASGVLSATYAVPGQSRGGCCLHLLARPCAPCCMFAQHLRCLFPHPLCFVEAGRDFPG